jgi:hypothetical protein
MLTGREVAQQSHSPHVAQHPICDIDPYTPRSSDFHRSVCQDCALSAVPVEEYPMTKPVSALRQRMIDDMKIRKMSPNTQYIYTRAVQTSAPSTSNLRTG